MSRLTNAILNGNAAYAAGHQAPMLDLQYGGQMGYAPDLSQLVSNTAYIRKNLICLLLEAPKGFSYLPNGETHIQTLRALVELHALSVDGLARGLEVETAETPVGGAGEMMEHPTNVTRARSQPVFRFSEKYGMPISAFFESWINNLIMNPETKVAGIGTMTNRPTDMLMDMFAATMAFIEPDPTHTKVVKAWVCTNMFPKGTGDIVGRRELTAASEETTYDITFSSVAQVGLGVNAFCQKLLDAINITNANPMMRAAFIDSISNDVASSVNPGYSSGVSALAAKAITL